MADSISLLPILALPPFGDFIDYKLEEFQTLTSVNLQGSFFLAQQASKQFIKQKSSGRIIFMSSVTGRQAHPKLAAYGMTKAALDMLAKSLSIELAEHKITVNAIAPGATLTERTQSDENYKATWEELTPTGEVCTTKDIANAALFFIVGYIQANNRSDCGCRWRMGLSESSTKRQLVKQRN